MYRLRAQILLLGVGHNRNSFLHHAETLVDGHRRKLRRFPYLVEGQRVWVEAPDVGDDNDTHFPRIGADYAATAGIRQAGIGRADCQLLDSVPFIDFARRRLAELLPGTG
jgi:aminoglycoside 3-N-acetyltransferase